MLVQRSGPPLFERAVQDISHAARTLWRNPGFAASAAVILAVGITASTGLFAVLSITHWFWQPLPGC